MHSYDVIEHAFDELPQCRAVHRARGRGETSAKQAFRYHSLLMLGKTPLLE